MDNVSFLEKFISKQFEMAIDDFLKKEKMMDKIETHGCKVEFRLN